MKDSTQILNQLAPKIAASASNSATAAGHPEREPRAKTSPEQKDQLIDAINTSFELLRINYQHLYFSAYSEIGTLNAAKRLWMENLAAFAPEVIVRATHEEIKTADFLPTISRIVKQCVKLLTTDTLPDAHSAYLEACQAKAPRQNHPWSHPAVYYAGKQSNWLFLSSNDQALAFPVFKSHYHALCERLARGDTLPPIPPLALPVETTTPLSKQENSARLQRLRKDLAL